MSVVVPGLEYTTFGCPGAFAWDPAVYFSVRTT